MAWVILIVSGALEAVWAGALAASKNFTKRRPTVLFVVAMIASMGGLGWAMTEIPVGTAYAVWVGIGAVLTILWAAVTKRERLTVARTAVLVVMVACVIGLKLVS